MSDCMPKVYKNILILQPLVSLNKHMILFKDESHDSLHVLAVYVCFIHFSINLKFILV